MQKTNYLCPIIKKEKLRDGLISIEVFCPPIAKEAAPGQFLHIACGDGHLLRRPISICDVSEETVRFVFEVRGEGTEWLSKQKEGTTLDILGPLGRGFSLLNTGKTLFIGGGIGVFPLFLAARRVRGEAHGVLGFQTKAQVVMEEEFSPIFSNLVITTDDGSYGQSGLVTAPAEQLLKEGGYDMVYACGPTPMLKGVVKLAQKYKVPCQVSLEERMGCGIGACLVCACKTRGEGGEGHYSHVCKDGPVFSAEEVVFDD
jgi:dihydroorotate dehydrogenase electron transfer subunit